MKIFVSGIELRKYRCTQDEINPYSHKGLRYVDGTLQLPLDFAGMKVNGGITLDVDCKVVMTDKRYGSYIIVQAGKYQIMFLHCYMFPPVGTKIKKGEKICKIAPTILNGGYPVHLHISAKKNGEAFYVHRLIYGNLEKGKNAQVISNASLRAVPHGQVIGAVTAGSVGTITKPYTRYRGGDENMRYYWLQFKDGAGYLPASLIRDTKNSVTDTKAGLKVPPASPTPLKATKSGITLSGVLESALSTIKGAFGK